MHGAAVGLTTLACGTLEDSMAELTNSGGHPDMDYAEHEATYSLFLRLLKIVTVAAVLIVIFLAVMWG